jgi:hypothetical protein
MKEEWLKRFSIDKFTARKVTPNDSKRYFISEDVIEFTKKVLSEYGRLKPPNEGFVYWAGKINEDKIIINSAFAPDTLSSKGSVEIKSGSNFDFVLFLSKHKLSHIANIHTHSGSWVGHSTGDDFMAPFKKPGLLSIVVPNYGTKKNLFLLHCGIHRFDNDNFLQLSNKYIRNKFKPIPIDPLLFDSRDKNVSKWK